MRHDEPAEVLSPRTAQQAAREQTRPCFGELRKKARAFFYRTIGRV